MTTLAPAGFLIWTAGPKGLEPQRWSDRPSGDYWSEKSGRVVLIVPLSGEECGEPLDVLAARYPGPPTTTMPLPDLCPLCGAQPWSNTMSRSGYIDDCDQWDLIRYRGAVKSAINGARGQAFLKEMLAALDSLPEKKLITGELEQDGEVCAIGAVGKARGVDMSKMDPDEPEKVAAAFGITDALAREVVFENDEGGCYSGETPEVRYMRMRKWIANKIRAIP